MNTLFTASNVNPIDSSLSENGFLRLVPKSALPIAPFRDPANFSPHKENKVLGCYSIIQGDGSNFIKQKQNTERKR